MRKKKRRYKKKRIILVIIILLLLIGSLIFHERIANLLGTVLYGYDYETIVTFREENVYNTVKKYDYSETLEKVVKENKFQEDYLLDYLEITYHDKKNFVTNINKLLDIGYKYQDINLIYKKLDNTSIDIIIKSDYDKYLSKYLKLDYFKNDYLERYLNYQQENKLDDYKDVITLVNIGLDKDYYTDAVEEKEYNNQIIVNKYHYLSDEYVPDLVTLDSQYAIKDKKQEMTKDAAEAFGKLCEAALLDGITIKSGSAYRSYNYQLNLYNRYVSQDGVKIADTYAARAGYSEHQTGLATDIMDDNYNYLDENSDEYDWMLKNSYKYGFILRYPEGKEEITGYIFEPWHYRYVGDIAKDVYESKLTYDEYVARQK